MPEVNSYYYFSYGNIHKPALLGMLGAIVGYAGYQQSHFQEEYYKFNDGFPEYYHRLKDLQVSIVPKAKQGYFCKKIQSFNNSVGYASLEAGGNLIVKEQWLENPEWMVYIQLNGEESIKISEYLQNNKTIFTPYLGKNDHPAIITDVKVVELTEIEDSEGVTIQSLNPFDTDYDYDEMEFKYEEYLPVALKQTTNQYILQKFILTDAVVEESEAVIYTDEERNIVFY